MIRIGYKCDTHTKASAHCGHEYVDTDVYAVGVYCFVVVCLFGPINAQRDYLMFHLKLLLRNSFLKAYFQFFS